MKPTHPWHSTRFGRAALQLGSIQFAVPVLLLVAAAMAWGTYLESMHDSRMSRATVYGSWWFIGLMGLIALSLIFAVVTRYPWKRRHVGFITVHAGLVLLIAAGFWSLFGRLEGHLVLEEGQTSNALETDEEVLELAEFNAGASSIVGSAPAPARPGAVTLGGLGIEIVEYWDNSREEEHVADGGPQRLRALELALDPNATSGNWIGEEGKSGGPAALGGLVVRVLPDGAVWTPPPASKESPGFYFIVGEARLPVGDPGAEAFPGWTITSVQQFSHALVSGGRLTESGGGEDNPAAEVVITDGKGTTERHTAFMNFPEMVLAKTIEGSGRSGARLTATAPASKGESLVVYGPVGAPKFGYISASGAAREIAAPSSLPGTIELDGRHVLVLREFSSAHVARRPVPAPRTSERRPALVLKLPGAANTTAVAYKSFAPVTIDGRNLLLRYGPRIVELPFSVTLKDFRKMDYPGTEMAMAYESDVVVSRPGQPDLPFLVHMNHPYAHSPWKVYQSGFMGENISIFSVMKDPGLMLTYVGSIVLCVGIYLTFFSRTFSWGHPGIPAAFSESREVNNAPHPPSRSAGAAPGVPQPIGAGV